MRADGQVGDGNEQMGMDSISLSRASGNRNIIADERKLTYQANGLYDSSSRYPFHVHMMDLAFLICRSLSLSLSLQRHGNRLAITILTFRPRKRPFFFLSDKDVRRLENELPSHRKKKIIGKK